MQLHMNALTNHQYSLLIIDDHPVYREALGEVLLKEFSPFEVEVLTASNTSEGMDLVDQAHKKWIVLLDVLMPGLNGMAGIKVFKSKTNVAHVISISGLEAQSWEPKAIAAGATLFISKNNTSSAIFKRIKSLYDEERSTQPVSGAVESNEFRLTQRQLEVLTLISLGHPNKIIADLLEIKEQTVKIHINQIFKELKVFNRTQAVLKAQKHQLLSSDN